MTKFLISGTKAINLATINGISISNYYLTLTTDAGLNAREIRFVYGTDAELERLFGAVMEFIASDNRTFDCDKFLGRK